MFQSIQLFLKHIVLKKKQKKNKKLFIFIPIFLPIDLLKMEVNKKKKKLLNLQHEKITSETTTTRDGELSGFTTLCIFLCWSVGRSFAV